MKKTLDHLPLPKQAELRHVVDVIRPRMSKAPAFFVPFAESAEQADRVYALIREFMLKVAFRATERRIYRVAYRHNGRNHVATVGEKEQEGEPVIAILEAFNPTPLYMICTPNRGVMRGGPILAGDVQAVVDFSSDEAA